MSEKPVVAASRDGGAQDWWIRRGDQEFRAPNIDTLRSWVRDQRVGREDLIHHASFGSTWLRADQVGELRPLFPSRGPKGLPLLIVGGFVLMLILGVATLSRRAGGPTASTSLPALSSDPERARKEQMFAERFGAALQTAISKRGQEAFAQGDRVEAQAAFSLANQSHYRVGVETARDLSERELDAALRDYSIIENYADATVRRVMR